MAFAAIATTVASLAVGLAQTISGAKQRKDAMKEAEAYQQPALENTMVGIATPQMAYNESMRQLARSSADAYSNLAMAGSRGMQMAGDVMDKTLTAEQQILAQQEKSLYDMALEQAKKNMRLREMMEARSQQDMAGIASEINMGTQTLTSGLNNLVGGIAGLSGIVGNGDNKTPLSDASQRFIDDQKAWTANPPTVNTQFGVQSKSKFGV